MNRFLAGIVVGVAICVVVVVGGVHYHDVGCWSDAGDDPSTTLVLCHL